MRYSRMQDMHLCHNIKCIDDNSLIGRSPKSSNTLESFSNDELVVTSVKESISDSSYNVSSITPYTFSGPIGICEDRSSGTQLGLSENYDFPIGSSSQCMKDALAEFGTSCSSSSEQASCSVPKVVICEIPNYLGSEAGDSLNCKKDPPKDADNGQYTCTDLNVAEFTGNADCTKLEIYQEDNCFNVDVRSHLHGSSKLCNQTLSAETNMKNNLLSSSATTERATQACNPDSVILTVKAESLSYLKCKSMDQSKNMILPALATAKQSSSYGQGQCSQILSLEAHVKVRNTPRDCKQSYEKTKFDSRSLEPSVQKVVQQLKLSKLLKQNKPWTGDSLSRKLKILLPYDSLVKLYYDDKVEMRPSGLINCGNSCYANAVIQCLIFTPPIAAYLLQGLHSKTCSKRERCFACELENLLIKVRQGQSPLSPNRILSHMHKMGKYLGRGREEDSHEFLRYAIDAMQSVCLDNVGKSGFGKSAEETNLIQLTFGGYLLSKIKCMKCHYKSERQEQMMDLTVEIEGDVGTLEEALQKFTSTEILDGENKYHCDRCKSYGQARKKLTIFEAPNILPVVLKRFQSGRFGKINKFVSFPESLDLTPFLNGPNNRSAIYKLYAVVVHLDTMNATFSGHYVCYVRNRRNQWYKTDDSIVKAVEAERVLNKNAYMLFYARCSPHDPSLLRSISCSNPATSRSKVNGAFSSVSNTETARNTYLSSSSEIHSSHTRNANKPYWTKDSHSNFNLSDGRFLVRSDTDSSSDTSSLFNCSDEGSCSTRSSRNSACTDECSECTFVDMDPCNWDGPSTFYSGLCKVSSSPGNLVDSSVAASDSRSFSANNSNNHAEGLNRKSNTLSVHDFWDYNNEKIVRVGGSSLMYSDKSSHCNKLTKHIRSRGTDWTKSSSEA